MEYLIEVINGAFSSRKEIEITIPFKFDGRFWIKGKICIKKEDLQSDENYSLVFDVEIARIYPLTLPSRDNMSIRFINRDLIGYPHINLDGSVCLHPQRHHDANKKLNIEIDCLKDWILDYYIRGKQDEHFQYLLTPIESDKDLQIFFTDIEKDFQKNVAGYFTFYQIAKESVISGYAGKSQTLLLVNFHSHTSCNWSVHLSEIHNRKTSLGLWVFIENEPIYPHKNKRAHLKSWNDLEMYLTQENLEFIYESLQLRNFRLKFEEDVLLMLGYHIPGTGNNETEVHWNLIRIPISRIPISRIPISRIPIYKEKIGEKKYRFKCLDLRIIWARATNASYDRFFGRGKFHSKLTNGKILIVGLGALGSALAEILVRGGCLDLSLHDFDIVETGNICRSTYQLYDVGKSKIQALGSYLVSISPFVTIRFNSGSFYKTFPSDPEFSKFEKYINQYDFVFDCSTDPEVTYMFDQLEYGGVFYSLAVTNYARNLVCTTGKGITRRVDQLFQNLESAPAEFFEGTGCGYPTFEASVNDIQALLQIGIKNIQHKLQSNQDLNSFVVKHKEDNGNLKLVIDEY